MISTININNYKSILNINFELGTINVIIGENGGGKTNLLESIAFAGAAAANKLDNEFLSSRGIRVTNPDSMLPRFNEFQPNTCVVNFITDKGNFNYMLQHTKGDFPKWYNIMQRAVQTELYEILKNVFQNTDIPDELKKASYNVELYDSLKIFFSKLHEDELLKKVFLEKSEELAKASVDVFEKEKLQCQDITTFLIYSPEVSFIKNFQLEGQIIPLGIKGEGLFRLIKSFDEFEMTELKKQLNIIDWFEDFDLEETSLNEKNFKIKDRFLNDKYAYIDQRSANEGFLLILFYFALIISKDTPDFFAIENVDTSLNPKLCRQIMKQIVILSKKYNKQVILTTHNPSLLDGLNINDDSQRLFVIRRNKFGNTIIDRISRKKNNIKGSDSFKLSESFINGSLGGLPNNF